MPHPVGKKIDKEKFRFLAYMEVVGDEVKDYDIENIDTDKLAAYLLTCKKRRSFDIIIPGPTQPYTNYEIPCFIDEEYIQLKITEEEIYLIYNDARMRAKQFIVEPKTAREDIINILEEGIKKEKEYTSTSPSDLVQ